MPALLALTLVAFGFEVLAQDQLGPIHSGPRDSQTGPQPKVRILEPPPLVEDSMQIEPTQPEPEPTDPTPEVNSVAPALEQGPRQAVPGAPQIEDPLLKDLLEQRKKQIEAYEQLNTLNPMSESYGQGDGTLPEGVPADGALGEMQKLLSNPAVQGYFKFFSNPAFKQGMEKIVNHPNRIYLLYAEIILLFITIVLRAWRIARSKHWWMHLWTRTWTWLLFWFFAVAVLPSLILGEGYVEVLKGFLQVATS